jgi:CheY-like chemotaxis protein
MAKAASKPIPKKSIETLKHNEAKRKNIPTAEYQSVLEKEQQAPKKVRYLRNTDLDPQLVWRGKDEQDWSDLVVHAPPLYIQEKVQPKVLIDDVLRAAKEQEHHRGERTPDLFADFNGLPKGVDKTEFYQHDQNWSNRMILGDSLQVMASLAEREGLRGKVQCIYFDPPYGIKFNSNFQWSTTSRDVKDGNAGLKRSSQTKRYSADALPLEYSIVGRSPGNLPLMKILVVDDHALIREALHGVLKKLTRDAVILEASNCAQTMEAVASHPELPSCEIAAHGCATKNLVSITNDILSG